jgi:hypothetical protein
MTHDLSNHRDSSQSDARQQRGTGNSFTSKTLDRGEDLGMDQPQSPLGARLRTLRSDRRCFHPSRHDPHYAATLDQANHLHVNPNFLDRLLKYVGGSFFKR